ncbi:MAG: hypothetical protein QM731_04655 [Chitinophagaceae bacterium]
MKQIIVMALMAAGITSSAFAKDKGEEKINEITVDHFHEDFPAAAQATWIKGGGFDKVTFEQKGETLTAYYDFDNNLMGTMQNVEETALPEKSIKQIDKHYPDYVVAQVLKFEDNQENDNDINYFYEPVHEPLSYFVELTNEKHEIILQVSPNGEMSFFKQLQ